MAFSNSWKNEAVAHPIVVTVAPAAHDTLIMVVITDTNVSQTFTWPSGFVEKGKDTTSIDGCCFAWAIKVDATGSETTLSVSNSGSATMIGAVASYSGRDNTSPLAFTSLDNKTDASGASPWAQLSSSATPSANGTDVVAIMASDVTDPVSGERVTHSFATTTGTTGAWTARVNAADAGLNSFRQFGIGDATQATAGAITVTGTGTLASRHAGRILFLLGLLPSGGGGSSFVPDDLPRKTSMMAILAQ